MTPKPLLQIKYAKFIGNLLYIIQEKKNEEAQEDDEDEHDEGAEAEDKKKKKKKDKKKDKKKEKDADDGKPKKKKHVCIKNYFIIKVNSGRHDQRIASCKAGS